MNVDTLQAAGVHIVQHKQQLSWRFRTLYFLSRLRLLFVKPSADNGNDMAWVAKARSEEERWAQHFKPTAPIESKQITLTNGRRAEWITYPEIEMGTASSPAILYMHGGGFTSGSIITHRALCGSIVHAAHIRALLVEYRLAPEHPFPAALDDTVAAYRWLLESGIKPNDIVFVGDSSGAALLLSALVTLRDDGMPLPAATVCLSAITDLACNSETWDTHAKYEVVTNAPSARRSVKMYLNGTDPHTPLASPLYANLVGLPPIFLQFGSREVLQSDAIRFAEKAREAGVDVTLDIWHGAIHSWQLPAKLLPESRTAIEKIGEFIQAHVGK